MTVGELKELLGDYGDHLEVVAIWDTDDGRERAFRPVEVYSGARTGEEPRVELQLERWKAIP